jgi:hypothetical protein
VVERIPDVIECQPVRASRIDVADDHGIRELIADSLRRICLDLMDAHGLAFPLTPSVLA